MNQSENMACAARSSMYRLLAGLFARELTEENIVGFQAGNGSELLGALEKVDVYAPVIIPLQEYFSEITDPGQAALDLAESYAWNFHGVGGPHAAPLYASVYLSESRTTHQQVEGELRKIIRGQGLAAENFAGEPYDHLSVILEFVAWLDEHEERDQQQGVRQEIVEKYLLPWLPAFVRQCSHADRLGFYSAAAAATLALVEADSGLSGQPGTPTSRVNQARLKFH